MDVIIDATTVSGVGMIDSASFGIARATSDITSRVSHFCPGLSLPSSLNSSAGTKANNFLKKATSASYTSRWQFVVAYAK